MPVTRHPKYSADEDAAVALDLLPPGDPMRPTIAGLRKNVLRDKSTPEDNKRSADAAHDQQVKQSANGDAPKSSPLKPLDIIVPDEIGRYTIGHRIGSGTCGVVHLALDNVLSREVAVKLSPIGSAEFSTGKVPGAQLSLIHI